MLDTLITSKTRIKLLVKFFLNASSKAYLRSLESEFGESTNAIRLELNKFEQAGLLSSELEGNKKIFRANKKHPLFGDIHNILLKYIGFDQIIDKVVTRLGNVKEVYVTGKFARGQDSGIIDLLLVGDDLNKPYLLKLIDKTEKLIDRKIRYVVFGTEEFAEYKQKLSASDALLLWRGEEKIRG